MAAKVEVVGCTLMAAIPRRRTVVAQNTFEVVKNSMVLFPVIFVALLLLKSGLRRKTDFGGHRRELLNTDVVAGKRATSEAAVETDLVGKTEAM